MPRPLPRTDFRSRRRILLKSDFGLAEGREPKPKDPIDRKTWNHIVTLPDDVAIRTSNHHGGELRRQNSLDGAWIDLIGESHDYMETAILDAGDEFQASTYASLTGYYRLAATALRSALEIVSVTAYLQRCQKADRYTAWRCGKTAIQIGEACDALIAKASALERHLKNSVSDTLFAQRSSTSDGGYVRRTFSALSDFAHSRPGCTDGDIRQSNGPIYVARAFEDIAALRLKTFALCFALVWLGRGERPAGIVATLFEPSDALPGVIVSALEFLGNRAA